MDVRQEHVSDGATGVQLGRAELVKIQTTGLTSISAERLEYHESPGTRAVHQLPPVTRDFVGREGEIEQLLASFDEGAAISALRGMGGVGKTQLALAVANRVKGRFPDGQLFLDLRGASASPLTAQDVMSHVIQSISPDARFGDDGTRIASLYHSVLADKRVLLVFDNAAGLAQVEQLVPAPPSAVIITSRQRFALPGLLSVDLDVLGEDAAVALLCEICPRAAEQAPQLASCCGYLPLAVRLIGSLLAAQPDLSPQQLVESLRVDVAREEVQKLDACFEASFTRLPPQHAEQWSALGILPDDFVVGAAAGLWELEVEQAKLVLSRLVTSCLVAFDSSTERYRLHDLLRDFAVDKLSSKRREALELRLIQTLLGFLWRREAEYQEGGEARRRAVRSYAAEQNLIATAQRFAVKHAPRRLAALDACIAFDDEGVGVRSGHQDARERLEWSRAALDGFLHLPWYRRLLLALRRRYRRSLAQRWLSLANALARAQQGLEAIELCRRVLRTKGLPRWVLRQANRELAWVYSMLGRGEALSAFEAVLELAETQTERAASLQGCADHWGNQGNFEKALELGQEALAEARGTREECHALQRVARYEHALGRDADAQKHWEESLAKSQSDYVTRYALEALSRMAQGRGDAKSEREHLEANLLHARESGEAEPEFEARVGLYLHDTRNRIADNGAFASLGDFARKEGLWGPYAALLAGEIDRLRNLGPRAGIPALETALGSLLEEHAGQLWHWQISSLLDCLQLDDNAAPRLAQTILRELDVSEKPGLVAQVHAWLAAHSGRAGDWQAARTAASLAWSTASQTGDVSLLMSVFNRIERGFDVRSTVQASEERTRLARELTLHWLELLKRTPTPGAARNALELARRVLKEDPLAGVVLQAARDIAAAGGGGREQLYLLRELSEASSGKERIELVMLERKLAMQLRDTRSHAYAVERLTREWAKASETDPKTYPSEIQRSFLDGDTLAAREAQDYPLLLELLDAARRVERASKGYSAQGFQKDQQQDEALLREMLALPGLPIKRTEELRLELAESLRHQERTLEAVKVVHDLALGTENPSTRLNAMLTEVRYLEQVEHKDAALMGAQEALQLSETLPAQDQYWAHDTLLRLQLDRDDLDSARAHLRALERLDQEARLGYGEMLENARKGVAALDHSIAAPKEALPDLGGTGSEPVRNHSS